MTASSYTSKLSRRKYHNWVKAELALLITKEGIEPLVFEGIQEFQLKCLDDICYSNGLMTGTTCSSCSTETIVQCVEDKRCNAGRAICAYHNKNVSRFNPSGCLNKICDRFKSDIQNAHRFCRPSFKNTDATQWCNNPWEIAKCFMHHGYEDKITASDTDLNGIINVVLNYKGFQSKVTVKLDKRNNIFEKVRDICRTVRHSPSLEIDDEDLDQIFKDVHVMLSDSTYIEINKDAQAAKQKLTQLENDILPLGEEHVRNVLDTAADVVKERLEKKSEDHIKKLEEKNLYLLGDSKEKIENLFQDKEKHSFSEISANLCSAVNAIKETKSSAVKDIKDEARVQQERLEKTGDEQMKRIEDVLAVNEGLDDKTLKDLECDLVHHYWDTCNSLLLSPLSEDDVNVPLLGLYIPPFPLKKVDTSYLRGLSRQEKQGKQTEIDVTYLHSLSDIFAQDSFSSKNLYITAEPGYGKSSFVNWLALNWCQAKSARDEQCCLFQYSETVVMQNFDFVFLLLLREMENDGESIEEMIQNNLIRKLARGSKYRKRFLEQVLCEKKCLIILDGLDEWSTKYHDSVPERACRSTCTYVTTTRPWRFEMLSSSLLRSSCRIEIQSISSVGTDKLISNTLDIFKNHGHLNFENIELAKSAFRKESQHRNIKQLCSSPVVLIQVLYLWNFEGKIGSSQCNIYSDMLELLLSRASRKGTLPTYLKNTSQQMECFPETSHYCRLYYRLLCSLGRLAFSTLLNDRLECSVVFDEAEAEKHLYFSSPDGVETSVVEVCVKAGLLAKQIHKGVRRSIHYYSFYHKTMQEYLAALYIQSIPNREVTGTIKKRCNQVGSILEMGTMFMFLSGLNPKIATEILQSLQNTINDDIVTNEFRGSFGTSRDHSAMQLMKIQDMIVDCVTECRSNNGENCKIEFPLQDIIIDHDTDREELDAYHSVLVGIFQSNAFQLKSLCLEDDGQRDFSSMMENFSPKDTKWLHKLSIKDFINFEKHIYDLLLASVETLKCLRLEACLSSITSLDLSQHKSLSQVILWDLPVSHLQIGDNLKQIEILDVPLSHIRLSEDIQQLTIRDNVPLSQCQGNLSALEECWIANVPAGVVSTVFECLPPEPKLERLICWKLESHDDVATLASSLQKLMHIREIDLRFMDLSRVLLLLPSSMEHLESVQLNMYVISMKRSALLALVKTVLKYEQAVSLKLEKITLIEDLSEKEEQKCEDNVPPISAVKKDEDEPIIGTKKILLRDVTITGSGLLEFVQAVEGYQCPVVVTLQRLKVVSSDKERELNAMKTENKGCNTSSLLSIERKYKQMDLDVAGFNNVIDYINSSCLLTLSKDDTYSTSRNLTFSTTCQFQD